MVMDGTAVMPTLFESNGSEADPLLEWREGTVTETLGVSSLFLSDRLFAKEEAADVGFAESLSAVVWDLAAAARTTAAAPAGFRRGTDEEAFEVVAFVIFWSTSPLILPFTILLDRIL